MAVGLLVALLVLGAVARATPAPGTVEPERAEVLLSPSRDPPAAEGPGWRAVDVPDSQAAAVAWYRVRIAAPADPAGWMLYLPYFYGGGQVWLNGMAVAAVAESGNGMRVRWERPLLLPLPQSAWREGDNELLLRVAAAHSPSSIKLPALVLGPQFELQRQFDRRLFVVRTLPLVTVATGLVAGALVIWIWLARRGEVAYGLFGVAAILWALRTTTFVFDALPESVWPWWRALYYAATGGFIATLALFTLNAAGWLRRGTAVLMLGYVALGPVVFLLGGPAAEDWVARWWVLGLVPMGLAVLGVSLVTAWRTSELGARPIAAAVLLAVLAGVHDYAVAWSAPWLEALLPRWSGHRLFLLHHAANVLLIVMGALLTARFVRSLDAVEAARAGLEQRVAERERELAAGYERIAALQRTQATHDERQRIMRELHDGLGSHLVSTLMRAERGALDTGTMRDALRAAIDEMRIAIDTLADEGGDLRTAFAALRLRWEPRLRDAGIEPHWQTTLPETMVELGAHPTLELLRIAQEALTNVLKHADARQVWVHLGHDGAQTRLEVRDDGRGDDTADAAAPATGRGRANMQQRAERLGASIAFGRPKPAAGGHAVVLTLLHPPR